MLLRRVALTAFALLIPVVTHAAASIWPTNNFTYRTITGLMSTSYQRQDGVVPDGAGGAWVGWPESGQIKVQHQLVNGDRPFGWPSTGVLVCSTAPGGSRDYVAVAPDAGQGVFVVWVDYRPGDIADLYVHHVLADASVDPAWPANGLRLTTVANRYDYFPTALADGTGGVYVCWNEYDNVSSTVQRLTRVTSTGAFAAGFSTAGVPLHITNQSGYPAALSSDGANGVIAAFTTGAQLRVQRILANGSQDIAHWPADGTIVSSNAAATVYVFQNLVSEVATETFLTWIDTRAGNQDAYLLKLSPNGITPGWPATGVAVAGAAGNQYGTSAVPDGSGGALVAWVDAAVPRIAAHHVLANGTLDPAWPAGGLGIWTSFANFGLEPIGVVRTAEGMLVSACTWDGVAPFRIHATRVRVNGTILPEWSGGPKLAFTSNIPAQALRVIADGQGGAVLLHTRTISGSNLGVVGNRIRWTGGLGLVPAPQLTAVRDVGPDEGGKVRLFWNASESDTTPNNAIANYAIWRQITAAAAQSRPAALPAGATRLGAVRTAETASGATLYWEYVGSWPSRAVGAYSQLVSTVADSIASVTPWETFVVDAVSANGVVFGTSWAVSGYSVDNLAPPAPAPFTGAYSSGTTQLAWGESTAGDFQHYELHRGASAGFVPTPANRIASLTDLAYGDAGPAGSYYKLAAVDVHGNIGAYALVTPEATTGVGESGAGLAFARVSANPARGDVVWSMTLPHAGEVELAVFDVSGRRAQTIVSAVRRAGTFAERWDGSDARGNALPNGVYVARLSFAGRSLTQRLTLVR